MNLDGSTLDRLWDFADPDGSLARLQAARGAASGTERDELTTQVARAHGLRGDLAAGRAELSGLVASDPVLAQRVALEEGRLCNACGDVDAARRRFRDAVDLDADPFLTVDACHLLAIVDVADAAAWTERGLRLARGSEDPRVRRWEGPLLNNHGWNLADAGRDHEALAVLRDAQAFYDERGTARQRELAAQYVAELESRLSD